MNSAKSWQKQMEAMDKQHQSEMNKKYGKKEAKRRYDADKQYFEETEEIKRRYKK